MNSIGIQAEIIYLNGAQEIAPVLGLSDAIIDLVDTGKTLTANGLTEIKTIADISVGVCFLPAKTISTSPFLALSNL